MSVNRASLTPKMSQPLVLPHLQLVGILARCLGQGPDLAERIAIGNLALVEAARGYKPSFGEPFVTYAAREIISALGRSSAAPPESGGARRAPLGPEEHAIFREGEERLRGLPYRELRILYLRFVAERSLEDVGKQLRIAGESARYIQNRTLDKLSARTPALPVLKGKKAQPGPARTIEEIESIFAAKSREVRDIVMYLAWDLRDQLPNISIHQIGRYFQIGPAAVWSGIKKVKRCRSDRDFRPFLAGVEARLRSGTL
jgi:RNA polymerase sigma factor (sigma-70 family)